MTEGLISTYIIPPPMPPVHLSYEKEEHIYLKTKEMQEYQKGKVLVNSWDYVEPVTIKTHPSLDIVQVEPQYVTNINTESHDHTTSSVLPH